MEAARAVRFWAGDDLEPMLGAVFSSPLFLRVGAIEECDVVLDPWPVFELYRSRQIRARLKASRALARDRDKPLLAFVVTDSDAPLRLRRGRTVIYRIALTERRRAPHEFALPCLWETLPAAEPPRPRAAKPVVGFCGHGASHKIRAQTLGRIARDARFETDFILRDQFWGGRPHDPDLTRAFVGNMRRSHFTLCDRGFGNFSMRLYQTLSCGRIPAFVDTGMAWPRTRGPGWRDVAVMGRDADDLANAIAAFWKERDIVEAQQACRRFFDENLAPQGFAKHLHGTLSRLLDEPDFAARTFAMSAWGDRLARAWGRSS